MRVETFKVSAAEPLRRLTVRLKESDFKALQRASSQARRRPAEVARSMVVACLGPEAPAMPAPAPPALADLAQPERSLLAACAASISNLTQIAQHAHELGYPQAGGLAEELGRQAAGLRAIGLDLKAGLPAPVGAGAIEAAAAQVNALAKSLNIDARGVSPAAWTPPLAALRAALAGQPG